MFSKDIIKLANNLYKQHKNFQKVASIINISKSTIQRWVSNFEYYTKPKEKQIRKRKLTNDVVFFIIELIKNYKQIQLKEIKKVISETFNIDFSLTMISNYLKELGYSRKLVSNRYFNKSMEDVKEKEIVFKDTIKKINIDDIISIDESYFYFNETPKYGWSEKGNKCVIQKPFKRNKQSLLLAISNKKILKQHITSKSINKNIYLDFLKELNIENKTIIADNVAFHKSKDVIEYLKSNEANMIFIPPYSPEYNPIEFVFSEIKRKIRLINFCSSNQLIEYKNKLIPKRNYFKKGIRKRIKKRTNYISQIYDFYEFKI